MNEISKNLTVAVGAIALLVALFALFRGAPEKVIEKTIVEKVPYGAVASPEIPYDHITINGNGLYATGRDLITASTTICAISSPAATSTLVEPLSGIQFLTSSTTAMSVVFAKSTNGTASTTQLGSTVAVAANTQDSIQASTTDAQKVAENNIFAPNTYFVVTASGGTGTFSPVGSCKAAWSKF